MFDIGCFICGKVWQWGRGVALFVNHETRRCVEVCGDNEECRSAARRALRPDLEGGDMTDRR